MFPPTANSLYVRRWRRFHRPPHPAFCQRIATARQRRKEARLSVRDLE
jgi:hypothetical protein